MMSKGLFSAVALALLAATTACRERTGSSLKDDGDNVNIQMAAILDNTCAEAGCHESENHRLPRDVGAHRAS